MFFHRAAYRAPPDEVAVTEIALDASWTWKSWIDSANEANCDFPLQNLPFCVFEAGSSGPHVGVGIGELVLDLHEVAGSGLIDGLGQELLEACTSPHLNEIMRFRKEELDGLRKRLLVLLRDDSSRADRERIGALLFPQDGVLFRKPVQVGNYTDFYASIDHATNVGRLFRPDQPLLPNYKFIPIGYHGRASSLIVSGSPVMRPQGQMKLPSDELPMFGPTRQLDFELEVGAYIGRGNSLGDPIPIEDAEAHLFGISLLNDWSARDVQAWEYQPLGPFLGKSFATSVSPWVVTMEALRPFRVPPLPRPPGDPKPLPYIASPPEAKTALDVKLEVYLSSASMREGSEQPVRLSAGNLRVLYWTFGQMIAHHTSNGCNLFTGDILASGTVSGAEQGSEGSLLEITRRGAAPIRLPNGEARSFLQDGDEVILRGFCEHRGLPRIGLGECRGTVSPARS